MSMQKVFLLAISAFLFHSTAWGQRLSDDPEAKAIYEKGVEFFKQKRFPEAYDKYTTLLDNPKYAGLVNIRYQRALCLKELKRTDEAMAEFYSIVEKHKSHILSNHQIALLLMTKPKRTDADVEEAKKRLLEAARFGFDAIGAIEGTDKTLAPLGKDVSYILEIIGAPSNRGKLESEILVDPFQKIGSVAVDVPPPITQPEDPESLEVVVQPDEVLQKQKAALDDLIVTLELVKIKLDWQHEKEAEELYRKAESAVARLDEFTHPDLTDQRHKARTLFDKLSSDIGVLRLKRFEQECRAMVLEMKGFIENTQFSRVQEVYDRLDRLLRPARSAGVMFQQKAKYWEDEGKKYRNIAYKLQEAQSLKIALSGIVYGKDRGTEIAMAIVNNHVVVPGDFVLKADGNPIPNLNVKKIDRNSVTFHYQGVDFQWYLNLDKPIGFVYVGEQ